MSKHRLALCATMLAFQTACSFICRNDFGSFVMGAMWFYWAGAFLDDLHKYLAWKNRNED